MRRTSGRWRGMAVLAAAVPLLATACGGSANGGGTDKGAQAQDLPIAASVEVTGANAAIGGTWKRGIELGVKAANGADGFEVAGKRYKWKLDFKDNQSLPDQAIANYRAFVGDKTKFILGPGLSTAFIPAFNALGPRSAMVVTPSTIGKTAQVKGADQSLFVTLNVGEAETTNRFAGAVIDKFQPKRVAILLPQDQAGESYAKAWAAYLQSRNIQVVYRQAFPGDTKDFSSYITALKAANPDLVLSGYLSTWLKPMLDQAVTLGLTSPAWVGTFGTNVSSLGNNGNAIKNFAWPVSTRAVDNAEDPAVKNFRELWKKDYGQYPGTEDFQALSYYDPILMLTKALQQAGTVDDVPAVTKALAAVNDWPDSVMKSGTFKESGKGIWVRQYDSQFGLAQSGKITYLDIKS